MSTFILVMNNLDQSDIIKTKKKFLEVKERQLTMDRIFIA